MTQRIFRPSPGRLLLPGHLAYSGGLSINWRHPLAQGLQACLVPAFNMVVDLVRPRAASATSLNSFRDRGPTVKTNWHITAANSLDCEFLSGRFSVAAVGYKTATTTENLLQRYFYSTESSNSGWYLSNDTTTQFTFGVFNNNAAANYQLMSTTAPAVGTWTLGGTSNATTRVLYVNGRRETTTNNSPTPASVGSTGNGLGMDTGNSTFELYIGCCWERTLSDFEMLWFHNDPFCFLQASYEPPGVGPNTDISSTIAQSFGAATQSVAASVGASVTVAQSFSKPTQSIVGNLSPAGTIAQSFPAASQSVGGVYNTPSDRFFSWRTD